MRGWFLGVNCCIFFQVEQEEEYIANRLLKRLDSLKREKQVCNLLETALVICLPSIRPCDIDFVKFKVLSCVGARNGGGARRRIPGKQSAETNGQVESGEGRAREGVGKTQPQGARQYES